MICLSKWMKMARLDDALKRSEWKLTFKIFVNFGSNLLVVPTLMHFR
jgi:hypothetical protein